MTVYLFTRILGFWRRRLDTAGRQSYPVLWGMRDTPEGQRARSKPMPARQAAFLPRSSDQRHHPCRGRWRPISDGAAPGNRAPARRGRATSLGKCPGSVALCPLLWGLTKKQLVGESIEWKLVGSRKHVSERRSERRQKLLYLVLNHAAQSWKRPPREETEAKTQFAIVFGRRFVNVSKLSPGTNYLIVFPHRTPLFRKPPRYPCVRRPHW